MNPMKIRVKMAKGEAVRFISHLDLAGAVEKAVRRASLPVALSEGFTPRLKISFASALALGCTSEGEYVDFELREYLAAPEFMRRLNETLPPAIAILAAQPIPDNSPALPAEVAAASYLVRGHFVTPGRAVIREQWDKFLSQPAIIMTKITKKKETEIDVKPLIIKEKFTQEIDHGNWELLLSCGQKGNLRPELLLHSFFNYANIKGQIHRIHRINLFIERFGQLVSPLARLRMPAEAGDDQ